MATEPYSIDRRPVILQPPIPEPTGSGSAQKATASKINKAVVNNDQGNCFSNCSFDPKGCLDKCGQRVGSCFSLIRDCLGACCNVAGKCCKCCAKCLDNCPKSDGDTSTSSDDGRPTFFEYLASVDD